MYKLAPLAAKLRRAEKGASNMAMSQTACGLRQIRDELRAMKDLDEPRKVLSKAGRLENRVMEVERTFREESVENVSQARTSHYMNGRIATGFAHGGTVFASLALGVRLLSEFKHVSNGIVDPVDVLFSATIPGLACLLVCKVSAMLLHKPRFEDMKEEAERRFQEAVQGTESLIGQMRGQAKPPAEKQ